MHFACQTLVHSHYGKYNKYKEEDNRLEWYRYHLDVFLSSHLSLYLVRLFLCILGQYCVWNSVSTFSPPNVVSQNLLPVNPVLQSVVNYWWVELD